MKKMLRILALTIVLATAISSVAFAAITDPVLPFDPTDDEIYYVVPKHRDICTNRVPVYYVPDADQSAVLENLDYFQQVYTVSGDTAVISSTYKRIRLTYDSNALSGYVNGLNLIPKKKIFQASNTLKLYSFYKLQDSYYLKSVPAGTYVRVVSQINAYWQEVVVYTKNGNFYEHLNAYIYSA